MTLFTTTAALPTDTLSPVAPCLYPAEHLQMLRMSLLVAAAVAAADLQYVRLAQVADQALFDGFLPATKSAWQRAVTLSR